MQPSITGTRLGATPAAQFARSPWILLAAIAAIAPAARAQEAEEPSRPRPAFFEESQRAARSGFGDSFLGDALNGVADPLGGGSAAGTGSTTAAQVSPDLSPIVPARRSADVPATPAPPSTDLPSDFDRTSVIIRRSSGSRSGSP